MRLPVQVIDSFQRSCLEDIDRIWSFMENKISKELRSSHSIRVLGAYETLQSSQMSSAWPNHNPEDGNADTAGPHHCYITLHHCRCDAQQMPNQVFAGRLLLSHVSSVHPIQCNPHPHNFYFILHPNKKHAMHPNLYF